MALNNFIIELNIINRCFAYYNILINMGQVLKFILLD